jgi:hypothetical protein
MRVHVIPALATLSTAALVVVGLDYATFAANGSSLILGQRNHATATTSMVNHGRGPVLSLNSKGGKRPSLRVSSPARVRRLNADMLDGKSANALASNAVTYRAGTRGTVYHGQAMWRTRVRPGLYHVSFKVGLQPTVQDTPAFEVICGMADLKTVGGDTPTIYTAESGSNSGQGVPTLISGAGTVRITTAATPGIVCVRPTDGGDFTFFTPLTATWTRINHREVKPARPVTTPLPPRSMFGTRTAD